jgi:hypothetical protein
VCSLKPCCSSGTLSEFPPALSIHDVAALTQPFWDLHVDPIMAMDTGAGTLVTIQINLAAGTLVEYLDDHPSIRTLVDEILAFNVLYVIHLWTRTTFDKKIEAHITA